MWAGNEPSPNRDWLIFILFWCIQSSGSGSTSPSSLNHMFGFNSLGNFTVRDQLALTQVRVHSLEFT